MGTNCVVFLANVYLFTYKFDFMERLIWPIGCCFENGRVDPEGYCWPEDNLKFSFG